MSEANDVNALVMACLQPMASAPRDGTEILAYHKDGKNLHPILWKDYRWKEHHRPHWGMRWNDEYSTQDGFYLGWIPYPSIEP